ncbi:LOW QUALITY PROTEIN: uncharacterized protein [Panulirus ornatus]|uniref:LOW QUALITY PROTEIN: uncharacterized protein n=1 Tax=Panulirus ornatus TaxID=150431 RepID=UPI003A86D9EA
MRLYTPAKSSSPGAAEDGEQRQDTSTHHPEDRTFHFDSRPAELAHRTLENETRFDEKLQLNASRNNDKAQLQLARLEDTLQCRGPRQEERRLGTPASPPLAAIFGTELNGVPATQNGPRPLEFSPTPLENGTDTIGSLDSVPWNTEGTETIKENGCRSLLGKWALASEAEGQESEGLSEEAELQHLREENQRLKAALKEAAEVNGQWRHYHEHRQKYVQRLLTTIQELQHPRAPAHSPHQLEAEAGPEAEVRRLREELTRLQADHDEHVTLLEMQVRAHRDDWEAERSEKQATQTALAEAQARTALLLQELQLLQAKLTDSESKRGLCWRCMAPRGETNGGGPASSSHSAQASPVPDPSPGPTVSAAPSQDQPQAPLKGWIPVSMLHHIAFSGATPEHQTPVVQSQQQQATRTPAHQHQRHQSATRPTTLNTSGRRSDVDQTGAAELAAASTSTGNEPKNLGHRGTSAADTKNSGTTDDRKKYEAMGARPKVLGDLQTVTGKGVGLLEDEKTAKHRARSILASAIPVSPVSSGPSTPFGNSVIRSPSMPNMPKGYMPITSTVLTPINFRPPFVAHKRPSAMKHVTQAALQDSSSNSSSTPTHVRSCSSPVSTSGTNATSTTTNSSSHVKHASNMSTTDKSITTTVSKQSNNTIRTSQVNDRIKTPAGANQDSKVTKDQNQKNETQSKKPTAGNRKSGNSSHTCNRNQPSDCEFTAISCSTATTVTTVTSGIRATNTAIISCSSLTAATTTVSCSSPATITTTTSSSSNISISGVNDEAISPAADNQILVNKSTSQPSSSKSATYKPSSKSTVVSQSSSHTAPSQSSSNIKKISQSSKSTIVDSSKSTTTNSSTVSKNSSSDVLASQSSNDSITSQCSSTSNTTAFASITVTTTAAPSAASTYSSATSSRSSSPGVSLTTFGLNSEGRGIPGAIFFALGSDQRGVRSPQPCTSPRRASTSSAGVKSPTPDTLTAGQAQKDALPPSGVKSPPVGPNSSPAPATVKEEHWWSVESPKHGNTPGRHQGGQGKLVNSTWVRLMGGQANSHQGSGLPWRTARAVSGQQLNQARKAPHDDQTNGPVSPSSVSSSTATFNYTPAINSPPSSTLSSATNSAASSPPPSLNQRSSDDLKSLASKNIASAIMSYELGAKCDVVSGSTGPGSQGSDGVATLTRRDLVCPSCQMLFPPDKHVHFLDHFEDCRGPEYADL